MIYEENAGPGADRMRQQMRQIVTVLVWIGFGTIPPLLADTPAPEATVATATNTSSSTATSTAAPPAAKPATSPSDVDPREKQLINMGFKPRMVKGQKLFCKREMELGSRVEGTTHCGTVDKLSSEFQLSREAVDQTQRYGTNPQGH